MSAPMTKMRDDRVDAMKFFAIAMVVLGHVISKPAYHNALSYLFYIITTVNMPLFMFFSGYVLFGREGHAPVRFVWRKFLGLMVPYYAWLVFYLLRAQRLSTWPDSLWQATLNPHDSSRMWFLYVLFVFFVIFTVVRLVSRSDFALIIAAGATIALSFLPDGDILGRLNVQWLFAFFIAGYLIAKHRERLAQYRRWLFVAPPAYALLVAIGSPPADGSGWPPWFIQQGMSLFAKSGQITLIADLFWKYSTAFAGIACTALLYTLVDKRWWGWQAAAGRQTMGIYVTQGWLLALCVGTTIPAAIGSWLLVLYVSLGTAMLLEQVPWLRAVLLGQWPRPRHHAPQSDVA